jgi:hypothetical protein
MAVISSPFIGRLKEIEQLRLGLRDATDGRERVFVISGEAGIGKSSLAEAISAEAGGQQLSGPLGQVMARGRTASLRPLGTDRSFGFGTESSGRRCFAIPLAF